MEDDFNWDKEKSSSAVEPGQKAGGYRYIGGDPWQRESWQKDAEEECLYDEHGEKLPSFIVSYPKNFVNVWALNNPDPQDEEVYEP